MANTFTFFGEVKTVRTQCRGKFDIWPPICRRCGERLEVGEHYYSKGNQMSKKTYHIRCFEEMYL